ncbi:MAG: galactokinase, partial [Solobacterium sp.]|nr:galactokinase [Solobacterium sp.]
AWLYCCGKKETEIYRNRYLDVLYGFLHHFGDRNEVALYSASGRVEIGGNHTDHQHGCVLASSINMDMLACVSLSHTNKISLISDGYDLCEVNLNDLDKRDEEEGNSISLIRGICKCFKDRNADLKGLDIYVKSYVPSGSGLSSSAAFETLLATILNDLFMGEKVDEAEIAKVGQYVENEYFGKPCGLMDQMACSYGGVIAVDFLNPQEPVIKKMDMDLKEAGLSLCIIDSGASHEDLTDEYAAVLEECKQVAHICGGEYLRDIEEAVFWEKVKECRKQCGDRAVLRAMHFFAENKRAQMEAEAIENKDYDQFLKLVDASGDSSWQLLQNIYASNAVQNQEVAFTIALAKSILQGEGAVRVHGGGFAVTVQAFVPFEKEEEFISTMDKILGKGSCHKMMIRPVGGIRIV